MALRISRYSQIYAKLAQPDVAHAFPRNVFLREPNKTNYKDINFGNKRLYVTQ